MPLVTFWMLNKNIDRISAERDMRSALVAIRSQSQEGIEGMMDELRTQMGTIVEVETPRELNLDRETLHSIAAIGDLTNHAYSR